MRVPFPGRRPHPRGGAAGCPAAARNWTTYPQTPPKVVVRTRSGAGLPRQQSPSSRPGPVRSDSRHDVCRRGGCVACQFGRPVAGRGAAASRPAKEGVTAVASAASSAARRRTRPSAQGTRVPQQSRGGSSDGAVALADDDAAQAQGASANHRGARQQRGTGPGNQSDRPGGGSNGGNGRKKVTAQADEFAGEARGGVDVDTEAAADGLEVEPDLAAVADPDLEDLSELPATRTSRSTPMTNQPGRRGQRRSRGRDPGRG